MENRNENLLNEVAANIAQFKKDMAEIWSNCERDIKRMQQIANFAKAAKANIEAAEAKDLV